MIGAYPLTFLSMALDFASLTPKQTELYRFIESYQMEHGASPTIREMCGALSVSSDNSIIKHLDALEKKGFITRREDIPRGIGLFGSVKNRLQSPAEVKIPLLGSIPAGGPVMSEEHIEKEMTVGEDIVYKPEDSFMLRVKGDSMVNVGIYEGDLVIACRTLPPKDYDVVIALVDGMNTVKTYRAKSSQGPYLQPENDRYKPIYPEGSLEIQGVVTAVIRMYKNRR
jgi:repressor LexA